MKILYLTYDGLSDPLGQSQILPYLIRLSKFGFAITIISSEKKNSQHSIPEIRSLLKANNIEWHFIDYTKKPPVISTLYDCIRILLLSRKLCATQKFSVVHCRSYIPSLVGMYLKKHFKLKFIFDMRGFYADERIDGRIWRQSKLIYRILYNFFKRQEFKFLCNADYTICLTDKAKKELFSWKTIKGQPIPIKVIPCCADETLFNARIILDEVKKQLREKLKLSKTDFLMVYTGAIGTWYMLDEMFDFFKRLLIKKPNAKFLFITHENPEKILQVSKAKQISEDHIRIVKAQHAEVPALLSLCDIAIFFIRPLYSKMASSPAKQAEIMYMEIPIICNSNIGDSDRIIREAEGGLVIRSFTDDDYDFAISQIPELLKKPKEIIRETALHYFSLEKGVKKYREVYSQLASKID